jgi:DNA polymerase-4
VILHADLDAFYASVAQRDNPSLRGKPVVVSGSSRRAVVLTASYEARPYGVRSAIPLYMALERCPDLVVVPPDFEKYRSASKTVFAILRAHALAVEGLSLDEAFLDLGEVSLDEAVAVARRIKDDVRAATSLTISIGAATGKMVAKIACDEGKPDGLVAVEPGTERTYLSEKPVGRLWGIGPKTQARLQERGIERVEQLAALSDERLSELFGRWGAGVRDMARGIDDRRVVENEAVRSISSEETFERDVSDISGLIPFVREQARELSERLKKKDLCAYTIGVKVKLNDFRITGRQTSLVQPTDDPRVIGGAAVFCLRRAGVAGTPVRLVGVRVSALVRRSAKQISLFQ